MPEHTSWDLAASPASHASNIVGTIRSASGIAIAWLAGLPRRAGRHLFAVNDEEARWHGWQVTEVRGGLGRQYRDPRFGALRRDGTLRHGEIRGDVVRPGGTLPAQTWRQRDGNL